MKAFFYVYRHMFIIFGLLKYDTILKIAERNCYLKKLLKLIYAIQENYHNSVILIIYKNIVMKNCHTLQ